MNRKRRGGFSILAAVLAVMLALFLGLLFWLLHGNEEPERILQGLQGLRHCPCQDRLRRQKILGRMFQETVQNSQRERRRTVRL